MRNVQPGSEIAFIALSQTMFVSVAEPKETSGVDRITEEVG